MRNTQKINIKLSLKTVRQAIKKKALLLFVIVAVTACSEDYSRFNHIAVDNQSFEFYIPQGFNKLSEEVIDSIYSQSWIEKGKYPNYIYSSEECSTDIIINIKSNTSHFFNIEERINVFKNSVKSDNIFDTITAEKKLYITGCEAYAFEIQNFKYDGQRFQLSLFVEKEDSIFFMNYIIATKDINKEQIETAWKVINSVMVSN